MWRKNKNKYGGTYKFVILKYLMADNNEVGSIIFRYSNRFIY